MASGGIDVGPALSNKVFVTAVVENYPFVSKLVLLIPLVFLLVIGNISIAKDDLPVNHLYNLD